MKSKKEEIMDWLTNPKRTVESGIDLFNKYGFNKNLGRFYANSSDKKMIISSLDNELRLAAGIDPLAQLKMRNADQPERQMKTMVITSPELPEGKVDPFPDEAKRPDVLKGLYKIKTELYVEVKQYNSRLIVLGDELEKARPGSQEYLDIIWEREVIAGKITSMWDAISEAWSKINFYAKEGKLPDTPDQNPPESKIDLTDPLQVDKRYKNLCTYVSKFKKDPVKNNAKLVAWINELNEIANLMNKRLGNQQYKLYSLETFAAI